MRAGTVQGAVATWRPTSSLPFPVTYHLPKSDSQSANPFGKIGQGEVVAVASATWTRRAPAM
jgi:hypothetical protein